MKERSEESGGTAGVALTCEDVGDLLYLYITEELEDDEAREVSLHLASCRSCRQSLSETVKITGVLSAVLPRMPLQYYSRNN